MQLFWVYFRNAKDLRNFSDRYYLNLSLSKNISDDGDARYEIHVFLALYDPHDFDKASIYLPFYERRCN